MSRPSDGFELDELRDEFDWMHEFLSRMAERITHDLDVHNLVDYVNKLEAENAKLREQIHWLEKGDVLHVLTDQELADQQRHEREMRASIDALEDENARLRSCLSDDAENARQIMGENAELRELVKDMVLNIGGCALHGNPLRLREFGSRAKELGIEADE